MNVATKFMAENYHHILGLACIVTTSNSGGYLAASLFLNDTSEGFLTDSRLKNIRIGTFVASILSISGLTFVAPPRLRKKVFLYTAAVLLPAFAIAIKRKEINSYGYKRIQTDIKSRIPLFSFVLNSDDNDFFDNESVSTSIALSIIGAVGLLLANIHLFKFTLPPIRKLGQHLMKNTVNPFLALKSYLPVVTRVFTKLASSFLAAKPYLPAATRVFTKLASSFVIGQGLGSLFYRISGYALERIDEKDKLSINGCSRAFAKLGFLAATITLLTGSECFGKYKALLPIIFLAGLGFTLLNEDDYGELSSSILPICVEEKSHAFTLIGIGAVGLYLSSIPRIGEIFKLIANGYTIYPK